MALYSKFRGSELIRSGLNKALDRVRRFRKKEQQEQAEHLVGLALKTH